MANTIVTSKIVPDVTRVTPYYNQFDEDNNYLTILFRPGYAVQATELTQIQSILQNQIERFGNHIFQNGSKVLGGDFTMDTSPRYLNLASQYANTDITISEFTGNTITYTSGNAAVQAIVVAGRDATTNTDPVIIVKYMTGDEFAASDEIMTDEGSFANIASSDHTGRATTVSVSEGVFFINGCFVKVPEQTIIADAYSQYANCKIGLEYSTDIVTSADDTDLLDPAQEATNYQAPGANRLRINFDLATRALDSEDDDAFIEFMRIQEGVMVRNNKYPQYALIGDTLARRTYEESGSYTIRPFLLNISDHPTDDTKLMLYLSPGKAYIKGYEYESIAQIPIEMDRARANSFVNNYDIPINYGNYALFDDIKGVIDITTAATVDIHCIPYGSVNLVSNAAYTTTKIGTARIRAITFEGATSNVASANNRYYRASMFDTQFANITSNVSAASSNGVTIYDPTSKFSLRDNAYQGATLRITSGLGSVQTMTIASYNGLNKIANTTSAFITTPNNASQMSIDFDFGEAESIMITGYTAGAPTARANANVSVFSKGGANVNGVGYVSDSTLSSMVFPFPQQFIKAGSISDQNYQYIKKYTASFTAGAATISVTPPDEAFNGASGAGTSTTVLSNFYVIRADNGNVMEIASVVVNNGVGTAVINATDSSYASTATIFAKVNINSGSNINPKKKTLTEANTTHFVGAASNGSFISGNTNTTVYLTAGQVYISNPSRVPDTVMSLLISDGKTVQKIYDLNGGTIVAGDALVSYSDVTSSYNFDTGQKDSHYDHSSISLKSRVVAPKGPLVVCMDWYEHVQGDTSDGLGYFSVDSYPNVANTSGYANVSTYVKSDGTAIALRDAIDFRPKRQNASNTGPNYTVQGLRVPVPNENFQADYQYYLAYRAMLGMTSNLNDPFILIEGESSLYPQWPRNVADAMLMYKFYLEPYTLNKNNVQVTFVENKNYTMRDIGRLEKRIENLEYYQTLSLLEKSAYDMSIRDVNGLDRTKYGVLVDNFSNFGIADVTNPDFTVAIDKIAGGFTPRQNVVEHKLYISSKSNVANVAGVTTLAWTPVELVKQTMATKWISVQPYTFADWAGSIEMEPDSDNWVDVAQAPDVVLNINNTNTEHLSANIAGSLWKTNVFDKTNNWWQTHLGTRT